MSISPLSVLFFIMISQGFCQAEDNQPAESQSAVGKHRVAVLDSLLADISHKDRIEKPLSKLDPMDNFLKAVKRSGGIFRYGKRNAGSMFRYGKRSNIFRYGKRSGNIFRYGKRSGSVFRYGKRSGNMFRYGKRDFYSDPGRIQDMGDNYDYAPNHPAELLDLLRPFRGSSGDTHNPYRYGREDEDS